MIFRLRRLGVLIISTCKFIRGLGCHLCPFYERYVGRSSVYHTCHHSNKTVKEDFEILWKFCELEDLDE